MEIPTTIHLVMDSTGPLVPRMPLPVWSKLMYPDTVLRNTWSGRPNRLIMPEERLQAASKTVRLPTAFNSTGSLCIYLKSVLNPYGGVPANTLNSAPFPMKRTSSSHQPVGTPHPKRQKINGLGNLRNPPQPVMTLLAPRHSAGPDLMRRRNTLSQMSGDEVEDAIKGRASPVTVVSDSDDEMNLRDSSKDPRKDPIAATPAFSNSIDGRVPDVRNTTNQIVGASLMPKPLHLDMRGLSRGPHYKRIHGMKSRVGRTIGRLPDANYSRMVPVEDQLYNSSPTSLESVMSSLNHH